MRLLVCGGRDYTDRLKVFRTISKLIPWDEPDQYGNQMPKDVTIIHGACPRGADRFADEYAVIHWCSVVEFQPEWDKYGKPAGPIRNQRMLDEGMPDLVVAFGGKHGTGTNDMVRRAKAAGLKVIEVDR